MSQNIASVIEFGDILFSEFFCFYLLLHRKYFAIFAKSVFDVEVTNSFLALIHESRTDSDVNVWTNEEIFKCFVDHSIIASNLNFKRTLFNEKRKLGEVYLATYLNKPIIIRRVVIIHHNKYFIEDLKQEIVYLKRIENISIVPLIEAIIYPPIIDLIYPYLENGSLHSVLHTKSMIFSFKDKIRVSKEIAITMRDLHNNGHIHGHLTSHNIMMNSE